MDVIRKKILALLEKQELSLKQVSQAMGRNDAYLHQFIYRKVPTKLKEDDRYNLAQILGIDEAQLRDTEPGFSDKGSTAYISTTSSKNRAKNTTRPSYNSKLLVKATLLAGEVLKEEGLNSSERNISTLAEMMCEQAQAAHTTIISKDLARWTLAIIAGKLKK